jgi:hypothetical protein
LEDEKTILKKLSKQSVRTVGALHIFSTEYFENLKIGLPRIIRLQGSNLTSKLWLNLSLSPGVKHKRGREETGIGFLTQVISFPSLSE